MVVSGKGASSSEVTLALPDVPVPPPAPKPSCHTTSKPVRLLSLDGGGIRGISSIAILREVMKQVNHGRPTALQPWQVFDMIGGTSTGGIIAIMLGCLRMTIDECHDAYVRLAKTIFKPKRCRFNILSRGLDMLSASERYSSKKFEEVIKDIISKRKGSPNARLHCPGDTGCKVFVTTVSADENQLVLLRSYHNPQEPDDLSPDFEMWQALRATSAATTYFEEFRHGGAGYVDGAFKSNNPVFQVRSEAQEVWPARPAFVLSIGTGTKPSQPLRGHALKMARTLTRLVTETEETWNRFGRGHRDMLEAGMLFRYSAPGVGAVDLGDHGRMRAVERDTRRWLASGLAAENVRACARAVRDIEDTDYERLDREARERERRLRETLSAEEKECLKTLHRAAPGYEAQRVAIEKPVPGTCEWFLAHPRFVEWMEKPSSMLWVTANPGCGKSVLASYLVDHITQSQGKDAIVCSFFFKAGEEMRRQAHQALCSLLHQVYTLEPRLTKLATAQFSRKDHAAFSGDLDGLWKLLVSAAGCIGERKLICVVDALDECSEGPRNRLCDLLCATLGPDGAKTCPANLRFLITSRPWPSLETKLRPFIAVRFRGEDASHALHRDLDQMVRYKVGQLQQDFSLSDEAASWLCRKLRHGADQTFLWVSLVLEKVADMPSRKLGAIQELLSRLPVGLDRLYDSALETFEHPGQSVRLLELLVAAEREMTVDEVNIALNITDQVQSVEQLHSELEPDMEWTIKRLGGFFVRISNSVVSLVHQTAREFLCDKASKKSSDSAGRSSLRFDRANASLGTSCVRFLLLRGMPPRSGPVSFENNIRLASNQEYLDSCPAWTRRFLEYSAKHWAKHLGDELFNDNSSLWPAVTLLCSPWSPVFNVWWPIYVSLSWTFSLSTHLINNGSKSLCQVRVDRFPAHYAAYSGDSAITLAMLKTGACRVEEENDDNASLLVVASTMRRNTRLVRALLDRFDATSDSENVIGGALLVALFRQHHETVRALLSRGIDVNQEYCIRRGHARETAFPADVLLSMPVLFNYSPMMEMLCENGLTVLDNHLTAAATEGCRNALAILLDHDERPMEVRAPGLKEAFRIATENGWPECRQMMLDRFKDLEDVDISRGLRSATERHDPTALHGILGLGAHDDGSALQSACETANEDTARRLLQAQPYSVSQLNSALSAYFDSVNDPDMRLYQKRMVLKSKQLRTPLYQSFKFTSTFGLTMEGKYAVLGMLSERGARVSKSQFIKAFAVVVPMDEDFASHLLDNISRLQDSTDLCRRDFLVLACLWGRERLVKGMLDSPIEGADETAGISPLLAATVSGNEGLVDLLVSRGAPAPSVIPTERVVSVTSCMIGEEVNNWWRAIMAQEESRDPAVVAKVLGLSQIHSKLTC